MVGRRYCYVFMSPWLSQQDVISGITFYHMKQGGGSDRPDCQVYSHMSQGSNPGSNKPSDLNRLFDETCLGYFDRFKSAHQHDIGR